LVGGTWGATTRGFETIYWGQVFQDATGFLNSLPRQNPRVLLIPKGVIYLLEFHQKAGNLRDDILFTGDDRQAARVDHVMFQVMQSDFTDLAWELAGEEAEYAVVADGTPMLVAYDRDTVRSALVRLRQANAAPRPSSMDSASSEMNRPTR
jgi:hypothetical protein